MDNALLLVGLAAGAYYLLSKSKGQPVFKDVNGNIITSMTCGNTMQFDVAGYSRVWMTQMKDGAASFDGAFNLPMAAYITNCSNDIGHYEVHVYEIEPNGGKGKLIGSTTFDIIPQKTVPVSYDPAIDVNVTPSV